ncbi:MAG: hypothetical protein EZS28_044878, partial [Streblomastix strix]
MIIPKLNNDEDQEGSKQSNVYVPPKIRPTEMLTKKERFQHKHDMKERSNMKAKIFDQFIEEEDIPDEILPESAERMKLFPVEEQKRIKEREEYEEESYMRTNLTKKERKKIDNITTKQTNKLYPSISGEIDSIINEANEIDQIVGINDRSESRVNNTGLDKLHSFIGDQRDNEYQLDNNEMRNSKQDLDSNEEINSDEAGEDVMDQFFNERKKNKSNQKQNKTKQKQIDFDSDDQQEIIGKDEDRNEFFNDYVDEVEDGD